MHAVSRSLPDTMWLTELKQNGLDVQIDGPCTNLTALSDFVSALGSSGLFTGPVEIIDSQAQAGTASVPEVIRFSVKARPTPVSAN